MKKWIAILLAAVITLGLCACGGPTYDEALMGVYTCYAGEAMGVKMDAADLFDDDCTIELKQGGKGKMHMDGDDYSLKYTLDGETINIEVDGETGSGTLKDGLMEVEVLELKLYLAKEGVEIPSSDAGYYILTSMTEDGETFDEAMLKELGLYGTMCLVMNEDGTGYMCFGEDDVSSITWEQGAITVDGETSPYTLEGDVLTIEEDGISMTFTRSDETPPPKPAAPAEPEPESSTEEPEPAEPDAPDAPAASGEPVSADLGDYHISIVAAEEFTDIDDNPAIRFYYDFTNNSDDLESAWLNLNYKASQEGYELVSTYASMEDDVPEYDNDSRKVIPGVTIRCVEEYSYKPDGGTLEFTITDYEDHAVTMEFDPQNLPGRPGELEIPTISDPAWTSGMASEGVYDDDYYVKIDHYEYTTGSGDIPLLRVYFEFTNNSEEDTSFFMAATLLAMQDGVELESTWASDSVAEDDNYSVDIAPGESIMTSDCFEVRSDSPIEIMVMDYWGDSSLGMVIPAA